MKFRRLLAFNLIALSLFSGTPIVRARRSHAVAVTLTPAPERYTAGCPGVVRFRGSITTDGPALAPNDLESSQAKFVLDCAQAMRQLPTRPRSGVKAGQILPVSPGVERYEEALGQYASSRRQQLAIELSRFAIIEVGIEAKLSRPTRAASVDRYQIEKEFREIAKETDRGKRDLQLELFHRRYDPLFAQLLAAGGIDPATERERLGSHFGLTAATVSANASANSIQVEQVLPESAWRDDRPPAPAPGTLTEIFHPPFAGARPTETDPFAAQASADPEEGLLRVNAVTGLLGFAHAEAFVSQQLALKPEARHVRIAADVVDLDYSAQLTTGFGYASAEATVNLWVIDGKRVVASAHRVLSRSVAEFFGHGGPSATGRNLSLACEFDRTAAAKRNLTLVVQFEGLVGVARGSIGSVDMRGRVRQVTITSQL